jgi:hypothetical protein
MGVNLDVDLSQLRGLESQIKPVLRELLFIDKAIPVSDPGMFGGHEIADALDHYSAVWKKGKTKLDDRLNDLLTMLVTSVATYEKAEATIGEAAQPGAQPAGGGGGGAW